MYLCASVCPCYVHSAHSKHPFASYVCIFIYFILRYQKALGISVLELNVFSVFLLHGKQKSKQNLDSISAVFGH